MPLCEECKKYREAIRKQYKRLLDCNDALAKINDASSSTKTATWFSHMSKEQVISKYQSEKAQGRKNEKRYNRILTQQEREMSADTQQDLHDIVSAVLKRKFSSNSGPCSALYVQAAAAASSLDKYRLSRCGRLTCDELNINAGLVFNSSSNKLV